MSVAFDILRGRHDYISRLADSDETHIDFFGQPPAMKLAGFDD